MCSCYIASTIVRAAKYFMERLDVSTGYIGAAYEFMSFVKSHNI
ncbi:hypothetical protein SP41_89 [Salmonella phage 41]|nr:hypothetical protein SP41_89 [Salmonella phage 41]